MTIENFIKQCGASLKDSTFIVVKQIEWLEILNAQISELFPDIAIMHNSIVSLATMNPALMFIDMSELNEDGTEKYPNLIGIKNIYLIDSDGAKRPFSNWSYDTDIKLLKLNISPREDDEIASVSDSLQIVWYGEMEQKTSYAQEIEMNNAQTQLLKKACLKEMISRVLLDKTKLDRYRTLVGSANEYVLIAMQKTLTDEVEFSKRKRNNTLPVRSF